MFNKIWHYLKHQKAIPETLIEAETTEIEQETEILPTPSVQESSYSEEEFALIEKLENFIREDYLLRQNPDQETETIAKPLNEEDTLLSDFEEKEIKWAKAKNERYDIRQTLGTGGMGIVQLAYDRLLGREVALKQIRIREIGLNSLSKKQQMMLWRLNKEARITALLEHPNIVPLYDLQRNAQGEFQFTMRKVGGKTLRQILHGKRQQQKLYEESDLLSIFFKVSDAVAYAHSKKVVHRDLKPENIMVGEFGEVYVMDWGIAKQTDDLEETKTFESLKALQKKSYQTIGSLGTPGYMPPEQQENASLVTPQSDIYALGKILRECFTLLSPQDEFQKQIEEDTKKRTLSEVEKEMLLNGIATNIPEEIQQIINKATDPIWRKRFSSVPEMLKEVEKYRKQQHGFNEAFRKAQQEIEASTTIVPQDKQEKGKKLKHLLSALNYLDTALILKRSTKVEHLKYRVGIELMDRFCENQDYPLANYIVDELKKLHFLSHEEKEDLYQQVEKKRTQLLRKHQARFEYWVNKFRKHKQDEREREDAIFEISKMQEEEIFQKLLTILAEGVEYFLEDKNKTSKEEAFYETMITALGRLENSKAGYHLLNALTKMEEKLSKITREQHSGNETQFMITLAQALGNSKTENSAQALNQLRKKMGHGTFRSRTRSIYYKLVLLEGLDKVTPDDANGYLERGLLKYNQMDLEGAIEDYTKAAELEPENAEAYSKRGIAKKAKRDLDGAIEDYTKAIELNPKEGQAFTNRAESQFYKGNFAASIQDCSHAIEINPEEVYAYYHRGNALKAQGELTKAIEDYTKVLELNPQLAAAYNRRGLAKSAKEDFDGAIEDYTKAILLNKGDMYAYFNRSNAKKSKGDFNGALEDMFSFNQYAPESHPQFQLASEIIQQLKKELNS